MSFLVDWYSLTGLSLLCHFDFCSYFFISMQSDLWNVVCFNYFSHFYFCWLWHKVFFSSFFHYPFTLCDNVVKILHPGLFVLWTSSDTIPSLFLMPVVLPSSLHFSRFFFNKIVLCFLSYKNKSLYGKNGNSGLYCEPQSQLIGCQ